MSLFKKSSNSGPALAEGSADEPGASRSKLVLLLAAAFGVLAAVGVLMILGNSADRVTYYVLGEDVAERTQIVPTMMVPVEVSAGGAPQNALEPQDFSTGEYFALRPLAAGDVVTPSVAGGLTRVTDGLPEGTRPVSFPLDPQFAVAGKVRAGDRIDIYSIRDTDRGREARLLLTSVPVLDVTTDISNINTAANSDIAPDRRPGPESNAVRGGIPQLYVVALSPEHTTILGLALNEQILVALNPGDGPTETTNISFSDAQLFNGGQALPDTRNGSPADGVLSP